MRIPRVLDPRHILRRIVPYRRVKVGGHEIVLDLRWPGERVYFAYTKNGHCTGALAYDVLAIEHFVKPGDVVLDAGANIGFTALLFLASGAGQVHAVEPDPRNFTRLSTLAGDSLLVYDFALSDSSRTQELILSEQHNQGSTLNSDFADSFKEIYDSHKDVVQVRSLDEAFPGISFDVLKIDVEGSEAALLRGARHTIEKNPPRVVIVEAYPDYVEPVDDILSQYYGEGYRLFLEGAPLKLVAQRLNSFNADARPSVVSTPPTYLYTTDKAQLEQLLSS